MFSVFSTWGDLVSRVGDEDAMVSDDGEEEVDGVLDNKDEKDNVVSDNDEEKDALLSIREEKMKMRMLWFHEDA